MLEDLPQDRLRRNVKELLEFLSRGRFQTGQIAGEFIWVEDTPHRCLKAWEFGSKLWATVRLPSEVQQFLVDEIIQCALNTEPLTNRAGCLALLLPDLVELHVKLHGGYYIAGRLTSSLGNRG